LISEAAATARPIGRSPFFRNQEDFTHEGERVMSTSELTDNLTFVSALQMLMRLTQQGLLTEAEAALTRKELERKLHPTLILA